ncbi:hypothetical protein [[Eubacterium] cellulosolvens]
MENMELLEQIALEIEKKLGHNHISTILHLDEQNQEEGAPKKLPQFLIIVKNFDKYTLMIVSNVLRAYPGQLEVPYVVEYNDISGILDSIPKSLLDIKLNYTVLAGHDIMEMVKPPSYEHFRAQMELTLRNDILKVRRDLIRVMSHTMSSQEFIKELSIVALNSIKSYYQIIEPKLRATEDILKKFNEDFPNGKKVLQRLLNYTYSLLKGMDISEDDKLQLILTTIDNVLQPMLIEIDAIGLEFEKTLAKESTKLSYEEFMEKYADEINHFREAMEVEFIRNSQKSEYVLRGELELKFRKREKAIIEEYEKQLKELTQKYEEQDKKFEETFAEEVEKRTTEFIDKKLTEEQERLHGEYEDKLKKIRDELEFKYITTDLKDREEKMRREFNDYERALRESFQVREKALREELDIKEKNIRQSIEMESNAKLEEQIDQMRKDFEEELDDAIERNKRKEQRTFESELKQREKSIETNFKKELSRKENELMRQFKRDLQIKENELKAKLQLNFEREKLKMESRKSEAFLKLIEQELGLRFNEIERFKLDKLRMEQLRETYGTTPKPSPQIGATRQFMRPPSEDETEDEDKGLFGQILKENRMLMSGLPKKDRKKVS